MKKQGGERAPLKRAARPSERTPKQRLRSVGRRRYIPPQADAIADIEKHDPDFVEREMKRIYADCKAVLERRRTRNALVDKLNALLVAARHEMMGGVLSEPRGTAKVLVSWQSPAIADELKRFDHACSELRELLGSFPGEAMTVERMFVRAASRIATYEQMARTLYGRPRGQTEIERTREHDRRLARVRALMKEVKAAPTQDGTFVFGG
jgi:hypothetical protein